MSGRINRQIFIDSMSTDIDSHYTLERKLGEGSFGEVYLARDRITNAKRAVKKISKSKIKNPERMRSEIEIMKMTDHPHIVKLYEVIEDALFIYLVMEVCQGGELYDYIVNHKHVNERKASKLFRQLLLSIKYLQSQEICHRDLKPENLIFADDSYESLKLIDFGLGKLCRRSQKMTTRAGTSLYISPDVLSGNYTKSCDLWSAGVILYVLLSGYAPFFGHNDAAIQHRIRNCEYNFRQSEWSYVSDSAKGLIRGLLVLNPTERLTVEDALSHPWILQADEQSEAPLYINVSSLRSFAGLRKFQKAVMLYIASQCSDGEIIQLKQAFLKLDKNKDGSLSLDELEEGLSGLAGLHRNEIRVIMAEIDVDMSGTIDYTEFIAASLDRSIYLSEDKLLSAFKVFDRDNSGTITAEELRAVLDRENLMADDPIWDEIIQDADVNCDGVIDFAEFCLMMSDRRIKRFHSS